MGNVVIGDKIRSYRKERRMTQQALPDQVGVTWEMISRYERGESIPFFKLDKISHALNVGVSELLQENYKSIEEIRIPQYTTLNEIITKKVSSELYTAPLWVQSNANQLVAICANIISSLPNCFGRSGVLFVSESKKPKSTDYVLYFRNKEIFCEKYAHQEKILGIVIGQEIKMI